MSRPTFSAEVLVRIAIKGVKRERPKTPDGKWILSDYERQHDLGPLPMCPDDQGLCRKLMAWEEEQGIRYVYLLTSGGGSHVALYSVDDASKITEWLAQHADRAEWNVDGAG